MDKIAVIGDYDSIYGFQTLGLSICPVRDAEEGKEKLRQLALECGIIYITEALAAELPEEIGRYKEQVMPAIIQIPGVSGNTGAGVEGVKNRGAGSRFGYPVLTGIMGGRFGNE